MRYTSLVPRTPEPPQHGLVDRILGQGQRIHIPLGATCNNRCLFCMEDNRKARALVNGALTPERVRWILDSHRDAEELCFTSGEPTLHPMLPTFIQWAKDAGCKRVSLMTNGRRLAYAPYTKALVRAGLQLVYISIHGVSAKMHDGLTRTPGSFVQTLEGVRIAASFSSLRVHTSTVVTRRNMSYLFEIYDKLIEMGVQQTVFNALQIQGGASKHFPSMVPQYREIRHQFERLLHLARNGGARAFLVDVPPCISHGLPDINRGFVEKHVHFEPETHGVSPPGATLCEGSDGVCAIRTDSLDATFRTFGPHCPSCRYKPVCPGVFPRYVQQFGWDEFIPVE
ncbi:MAG TPA: radical SAM protein [Polyangiaceae bacterium]|nr:MAG: Cyclic pyranopterin monophosphate synthase [Deltaproteobacteria bacterium ADurb.Bin207]HNZ20973.1 radical SAM protein [Polyangiaceae bacterium]HOD23878.1 radical SAM protein [Polyangiaceae bacterium]HOE48865.1 radical SAM protein [Polyangiaceae bacterium]HOG98843.1 radical SAM protein [Polyangiaceae bacterium]